MVSPTHPHKSSTGLVLKSFAHHPARTILDIFSLKYNTYATHTRLSVRNTMVYIYRRRFGLKAIFTHSTPTITTTVLFVYTVACIYYYYNV